MTIDTEADTGEPLPDVENLPAVIDGEVVTEAESIPPRTSIDLPVNILRAALTCTSDDETRHYLQGVYLHRTADGWLRAVATDGHRMLVANLGHWSHLPEEDRPDWLGEGVIVPADKLAARLSIISKGDFKPELCALSHAAGAWMTLASLNGDTSFRFDPIEGEFPDYQKLIGKGLDGVFNPEGRDDFVPAAFSPANLKSTTAIAAALGADSIMLYVSRYKADPKSPNYDPESASLVTFGAKAPGVVLYLMGMRHDAIMPEATREIMAPAIKLSIAALKAHETRNRKAAKKATGDERERLTATADAFKARIEAIVAKAGSGLVALPAPKPEPEPEAPPAIIAGDEPEEGNPYAIGAAVTTDDDAGEPGKAPDPHADDTDEPYAPTPEPEAEAPPVEEPTQEVAEDAPAAELEARATVARQRKSDRKRARKAGSRR